MIPDENAEPGPEDETFGIDEAPVPPDLETQDIPDEDA